jgi:hypothetical protein
MQSASLDSRHPYLWPKQAGFRSVARFPVLLCMLELTKESIALFGYPEQFTALVM